MQQTGTTNRFTVRRRNEEQLHNSRSRERRDVGREFQQRGIATLRFIAAK